MQFLSRYSTVYLLNKQFLFWFVRLCFGLMVFIGLTPGISVVGQSNQLIISEINYAGSSRGDCPQCAFDKWIELYNPSSEVIPLKGWKLAFLGSNDPRNILELPDEYLPGYTNFLIANKRSDIVPTFSLSGVTPDLYSGKVLYVSNNENKTLRVDLMSPTGGLVSSVRIGSESLTSMEQSSKQGSKFSIVNSGGNWIPSTSEYFPNNFGTPKARGFYSPPQPQLNPVQETVVIPSLVVNPQPVEIPVEPRIITQPTPKIEAKPALETTSPILAQRPVTSVSSQVEVSLNNNTVPVNPLVNPLTLTKSNEQTVKSLQPKQADSGIVNLPENSLQVGVLPLTNSVVSAQASRVNPTVNYLNNAEVTTVSSQPHRLNTRLLHSEPLSNLVQLPSTELVADLEYNTLAFNNNSNNLGANMSNTQVTEVVEGLVSRNSELVENHVIIVVCLALIYAVGHLVGYGRSKLDCEYVQPITFQLLG